MADYIISPYAISFDSIKEALQNYIRNKSVNTWQDFYVSGAGETIVELDAAIAAFYAFHFIIGRREAYLPTAQNYASVVGAAETLGYNVSRGHNLYIEIEIVPNATQTLAKWSVIGSYAEYDIVLIEPAILNAGEPTTVKCVIGNSQVQVITITNKDLQQFTFTANDSTDDCRLILNNQELPCATSIEEAIYDKWIMLTNVFGAVDAFYLNDGDYKYTADDKLYFQYIQRNNLKYGGINPNNLSIDIADVVDNVILIEDLRDVEDKEHIRLAAPLKHETNNVVRARKDYAKYLLAMNPNLVDVNDKDINPGLIALTYLKSERDENSILTQAEKEAYVKTIMSLCPDGVAKAFIEDPIKVIKSLAISLWKNPGQNISITVDKDIDAILDGYRNQLHPTFDLEQLEHDIEQLPGVKVARVNYGATEYQTNTNYKLYDIVSVPNVPVGTSEGVQYETWTFYCGKVQPNPGEEEPDWVTASTVGSTIIDNNLVWQNANKYADNIYATWEPDGKYDLYSDINVSYEIPPYKTSNTEPQWGRANLVDGNVSMSLAKTEKLAEAWEHDKEYEPETCITVGSGDSVAIYKVSNIDKAKSGDTEPTWKTGSNFKETVTDNAITWVLDKYSITQTEYNCIGREWQPMTEYTKGQCIIASDIDTTYVYYITYVNSTTKLIKNKIYSVINYAGRSGSEVTWGDENVVDNNILWTQTTDPSDVVWEPNKQYKIGTIITTEENGNYVFTALIGTSGEEEPDWTSISNNTVKDNNIVWYRLDNNTAIPLQWNEYLDLSFTSKIVG